MRKEDWLEWRSQGIGASDAPIILGVAPKRWKINSPFKLWQLRKGLIENEMNSAMMRGQQYEDEALGWFQNKIGKCMFSQQCFEHPELNWMRATFDGIDLEGEVSVELKVSSLESFEQVKAGKIPPHYLPQVLHQMHVKPTKAHYFCVYVPQYQEGAYVEVAMDEDYIGKILKKEKEFWECLQNSTPPELTENDFIDRTGDENWLTQARILADLQNELRELKKREDEAKKVLIELSDNQSCAAENFKLTKYFIKGRVDYDRIPQLKDIDLDDYRKGPTMAFKFS